VKEFINAANDSLFSMNFGLALNVSSYFNRLRWRFTSSDVNWEWRGCGRRGAPSVPSGAAWRLATGEWT